MGSAASTNIHRRKHTAFEKNLRLKQDQLNLKNKTISNLAFTQLAALRALKMNKNLLLNLQTKILDQQSWKQNPTSCKYCKSIY